jgi:replication-associated recombination protein RarA
MPVNIIKNPPPALIRPVMTVDGKLSMHLEKDPILSLMNKSHFCLFAGKAGSGKTVQALAMLQTPDAFKNVFETLIIFTPPNSRDSVQDNPSFGRTTELIIFNTMTPDTLTQAYDIALQNGKKKKRTLMFFDDMQRFFREKENSDIVLHMVNNRRHARLSMWVLAQNYMSLERPLRSGITDVFIFKSSKKELESVLDEQLDMQPAIIAQISPYLFREAYEFAYINTATQRIFSGWNEIVIE